MLQSVCVGLTREARQTAEVAADFTLGILLGDRIDPYKGFRFTLAPGLEHRHDETEFLFRIGMGYEFVLSPKWVVSPEINVDFSNGEEIYVIGLAFGF